MVITSRLYTWTGAEGSGQEIFLYATWDSKEEQEDGTFADPTATGLVSSIRYKNTWTNPKTAIVGGRTYVVAAGTPDTTLNIPTGQRPNMYDTPWSIH